MSLSIDAEDKRPRFIKAQSTNHRDLTMSSTSTGIAPSTPAPASAAVQTKTITASNAGGVHLPSPPAATVQRDWWGNLVNVARIAAGAAEFAPFPYMRGASAAVVSLLEIIERDNKNREDLREFAQDIVDIIQFVQGEVKAHGQAIPSRFLELCKEFDKNLLTMQKDIKKMRKARRGCGGWVRGVLSLNTTQAKIISHQQYVKLLRENLALGTLIDLHKHIDMMRANTLLVALQPVSVNERRSGYADKCMPGTRLKVFEEIDEWLGNPDAPNIFWLSGSPGAGKSAVASTLVERLRESGRLGSFFPFKRGNANLTDATAVWRTIAFDLARDPPASQLEEFHLHMKSSLLAVIQLGTFESSSTDIERQFKALIDEPIRAWVGAECPVLVIDALDECESSGQVLRWKLLLKTLGSLPKRLKLFITGRNYEAIRLALGPVSQLYVLPTGNQVTSEASQDIFNFLETNLQDTFGTSVLSWPGSEKIQQLASKAAGLFIWAKTVLAFLDDGDPHYRFDLVLESTISAAGAPSELYASINSLYITILQSSFGQATLNELTSFKLVAGTIVLSKVPLDIETLRHMLLGLASNNAIEYVLKRLTPMLSASPSSGNLLEISHLSFSEFLTSPSHCSTKFLVDVAECNQVLANRCLQILNKHLVFNICHLPSSYIANDAVPDLSKRLETHIPNYLHYACLFWAEHLAAGIYASSDLKEQNSITVQEIQQLLYSKLLYWLEVLSLIKGVPSSLSSLSHAVQFLETKGLTDLKEFAIDASRFIAMFRIPISQSAPHIYLSAIPFAPIGTLVSKQYLHSCTKALKVTSDQSPEWPAVLHVLEGHTSVVNCLAYSSDGRKIVSGSRDNTIRIWDAATGKELLLPLDGHTDWVNSVAYSPNSKKLVSGSKDGTVRIWNAETGREISQFSLDSEVPTVAYSPDTNTVVSGSGNIITIWNIETKTRVFVLQEHSDLITSVTYSANGKLIASGSLDKTILIWNAQTGKRIFKPLISHTAWISSVAFSPNGNKIASGSGDGTVRVWNIGHAASGTQKILLANGHTAEVASVTYSADGSKIFSGSYDNTIRAWNANTSEKYPTLLEGHSHRVLSISASIQSNRIASCSWDNTIRIWNSSVSEQELLHHEGHDDWVTCVAFSPDGKYIASSSLDNTVRVWDAVTGKQVNLPIQRHSDRVMCVAYSSDGTRIVSSSSSNTDSIKVWNAQTGQQILITLSGHSQGVNSVAYSYDGQFIVSGSRDYTVRIWNATNGKQILPALEGHTNWVTSVAYSPDCTKIVSGSRDKTARIWDAKSGVTSFVLQAHTNWIGSVAFSPNSERVVTISGDQTVKAWEVRSGNLLPFPFEGHTNVVNSVAYSHNGQRIVTTSQDNMVREWDANKGVLISVLEGHSSPSMFAVYSPDDLKIVSGSRDNTIRVWLSAGVNSETNSRDISAHWKMTNGWIQNADGLLFWVPQDVRPGLYRTNNALIINRHGTTHLDLSNFSHGPRWSETFTTV
ncbi:Vegetative incompatibility protein HET-E-1 [Hypsizygus marmoreus]|uniref:Vegetative incompatibility protein HET-E-1 n=1 Tax=Hypsizygus marmoreus TaxID=39966 RepID=A0A369KGS0_HYPMA|nr:Vegetative incompatibility protein HET-E-1 [Hypsizygus marmoreus]